ncbi:5-formyltetrahydrofolate cyclo-ligase [bacterium]|nr:5-formyltetrahydrofolate cyclo-ligase [bacterium]
MKKKVRDFYRDRRALLSSDRREEAAEVACKELLRLSAGYDHILSYYSLPDEVDTYSFNDILSKQHRLSLPKIEGESLVPYEVNSMEKELKTFSHQFLEPVDSCSRNNSINFVVVPGIAFDRKGGRIGFGKGYYDRFLEGKKVKVVGLLFKEQFSDELLPIEAHDVCMEELCIV